MIRIGCLPLLLRYYDTKAEATRRPGDHGGAVAERLQRHARHPPREQRPGLLPADQGGAVDAALDGVRGLHEAVVGRCRVVASQGKRVWLGCCAGHLYDGFEGLAARPPGMTRPLLRDDMIAW